MKAHLHSAIPKLRIGVFPRPQSRPWSQGGGRLSVTFRAPWGISGCALARADVNWRVDLSEQRTEYVWKNTCLVRETGPASKKTQPEECTWTGRPVAHAGWTYASDVTRRGGRRDAELWRRLRRGTWWSCRVPHHRRGRWPCYVRLHSLALTVRNFKGWVGIHGTIFNGVGHVNITPHRDFPK